MDFQSLKNEEPLLQKSYTVNEFDLDNRKLLSSSKIFNELDIITNEAVKVLQAVLNAKFRRKAQHIDIVNNAGIGDRIESVVYLLHKSVEGFKLTVGLRKRKSNGKTITIGQGAYEYVFAEN